MLSLDSNKGLIFRSYVRFLQNITLHQRVPNALLEDNKLRDSIQQPGSQSNHTFQC